MAKKIRLDLQLLTKGLVASREKAQSLIRAGKVRDPAGQILDKPGHQVPVEMELRVEAAPRYASRGGEKLVAALNAFPVSIQGRICLDGGISTGGFTDCLLQHGASCVYGIDVGYGQTAWDLRNDKRVVLRERTNIRTLIPDQLYGLEDRWPSLVVADLSFISLTLVLPAIRGLLEPKASEALLLVKPQFEVGRERVSKGGVVRDLAAHVDALKGVITSAKLQAWQPKGLIASPLTGPAGNHEYLLWLGEEPSESLPSIEKVVKDTLS